MKYQALKASIWIGALAAFILISRAPERISNGYMWAEDGAIFMNEAYQLGLASIFHPYAGYLHLLPRLIAVASAYLFGIHSAPYIYVDCALIISVSISVYLLRAGLRFPWKRYPMILSALLALSPWLVPANNEVLLNVTNLQWVLAPALMMLLWECCGPDDGRQPAPTTLGLRMAATALLTLTGPICILLMPAAGLAFLWRMRRSPTWHSLAVFAVYSLGTLTQAAVYLATREPTGERGGLQWMHELVAYLVGPALIPQPLLDAIPVLAGVAAGAFLLCLLAGGATSAQRWPLACLFYVFMATWMAGLLRDHTGVHFSWYGNGARYTYPPELAMIWALLIIIGTARHQVFIHAATGLAVWMVLTGMTHYALADQVNWRLHKTTAGYQLKLPPNWTADLSNGRIRIHM